jgi:hypothetical protein
MTVLKYVCFSLVVLALAAACGYMVATSGSLTESVSDFVFWSLCILVVLLVVGRQLIRETLVQRLIQLKHSASMTVSSWVTSGDGFTVAVNHEYIWGNEARELLQLPDVRKLVLMLRAMDMLGPLVSAVMIGLLTYELGRPLG